VAEFKPAIDQVLGEEGGFTDNPKDRGNWTSGIIGVGELKGTKWGLSAMTYPHLDIKNLTREQAVQIYFDDWWTPGPYGLLRSQPLANKMFSFAVNGAAKEAAEMLQIVVNACGRRIQIDGVIGPQTLSALNAFDPTIVYVAFKSAMGARYDCINDMNRQTLWAREGWFNRAFA
jgi:lysozyme family protein